MDQYLQNLNVYARAIRATFFLWPARSLLLVVLTIVRALSLPLAVWLTGYIINEVVNSAHFALRDHILLAACWLVSLSLGSAISPWVHYIHQSIADRAQLSLQVGLIEALNSVPDLVMHEDKAFHDDVNYAQRCLEYSPTNFMNISLGILECFITSVSLVYLVVSASWVIGLVMLISIIPHAWMMVYLSEYNYWNARLSTKEWREVQYSCSTMSNPSFAKEVRMFGQPSFLVNKTRLHFSSLAKMLLTAKFKSTTYPIPTLLILQLGSVVCLLLILQGLEAGTISTAAIVIILHSLYSIQGRLEQGLNQFNLLIYYRKNFRAIFNVLDIKPQIKLGDKNLSLDLASPINIKFEDVCFAYPGGPQVLSQLNFTWRWQDNLALVGENGSGKSTIVKLLLRYFDPDSGTIYVNDVPLEDYNLDNWRAIIAPVFQDFARYEYSIRENICFDDREMDDDELEALLIECGLGSLIETLPSGLDTRLGKRFGSTDLSGGQWQKLAIARALCKKSSVMVLDEPTAALDPIVESDIYSLFEHLCKNKSSLMITHRLGSVRMADSIIVLDGGRIVEQGSHQELLALNKIYAGMFESQAAWYKGDERAG